MTPEEAGAYMDRAYSDYAESVLESRKEAAQEQDAGTSDECPQKSLPSNVDMVTQILAEFGVWESDEVDDTAPGWVDRREEIRDAKER